MVKMMTEGKHSEMDHTRLGEGTRVIFEDTYPNSTLTSSRTTATGSHSSSSHRRPRDRDAHRRRHRSSSSSSSSSRSSSRPRSRSHPRCYRPSSRCRCSGHVRYSRKHRRSPPRRYRAHSRSCSPSSSSDRSPRQGSDRSRSRSRRGSPRAAVVVKTNRSHSKTRSSRRSAVSLTLDEKKEFLRTAKVNAGAILGLERLDLPDSVKPILGEQQQPTHSPSSSPASEEWVSPVSDTGSTPAQKQDSDLESEEDYPSPKMSPKRKLISFSIHNSVAKPTVAAPPVAKVTPRVDSFERRKPYGQWMPVASTGRKASESRKHTHASR